MERTLVVYSTDEPRKALVIVVAPQWLPADEIDKALVFFFEMKER